MSQCAEFDQGALAMQNFRWKWIGYYTFSNLLIAAGCCILMWIALQVLDIEIAAVEYLAYAAAICLAAVGLAAVFGYLYSKRLHSRISEISYGVKALAYGDLNYRLPFTKDRDLGEIASAFNEMADRIDAQVSSLQRLAEENEKLIQQAKSVAVTEERQRLAQELHDAVSQQLFAIALTSATAAKIFDQDPVRAAQLLRQIEQSAAQAQAEMRALLLQLRPQTLENRPLADAIRLLAQELAAKIPIKCHLKVADLILPAHTRTTCTASSRKAWPIFFAILKRPKWRSGLRVSIKAAVSISPSLTTASVFQKRVFPRHPSASAQLGASQ